MVNDIITLVLNKEQHNLKSKNLRVIYNVAAWRSQWLVISFTFHLCFNVTLYCPAVSFSFCFSSDFEKKYILKKDPFFLSYHHSDTIEHVWLSITCSVCVCVCCSKSRTVGSRRLSWAAVRPVELVLQPVKSADWPHR